MDGVDSNLNASSAAFAKGDNRDAFNGYLKSINGILVALTSAAQWSSPQEVKSLDGTADMFRKAKEALHRAEEILRLSKVNDLNLAPALTAVAPTVLGSALSNPIASSAVMPPSLQLVGASSAKDFMEEAEGLPIIPLSPLSIAMQFAVRDFKASRDQYAVASATSTSNPDTLSKLRRLLEDVRIAETRVNSLKQAMEVGITGDPFSHVSSTPTSIEGATGGAPLSFTSRGWTVWSSEGIARQIAATNARLFLRVPLLNPAMLNVDAWDRCTASLSVDGAYLYGTIRPCLDFARYLERVVVGSVLSATQPTHYVSGRPASIYSNTNANSAPTLSESAVKAPVAAPARAQTIQAIVAVAYILIHTYHDLNGAVALLRGLLDPRILRLRKTWELVTVTCKDVLKRLEEMLFGKCFEAWSPAASLAHVAALDEASTEVIGLVAELLDHHYVGGGVTVLVPYLEPFIKEIEDLKKSYTVARDGAAMAATPGAVGVPSMPATVLSDVGQRAVEDVFSILKRCRGYGPQPGQTGGLVGDTKHLISASNATATTLTDAWSSLTTLGNGGSGIGQPDGGPVMHPPWERPLSTRISDVTQIGVGDRRTLHWILSRVYRSERELWNLSFLCEDRRASEDGLGYVPRPESSARSVVPLTPAVTPTAGEAGSPAGKGGYEVDEAKLNDMPKPFDKDVEMLKSLTFEEMEVETTDPARLDDLLALAKGELDKANSVLTSVGATTAPAETKGSVGNKLVGLFGGRGGKKAKEGKPDVEKDDNVWSEDGKDNDEDDDDDDEESGDLKEKVPRKVWMAALTAGLAGVDADSYAGPPAISNWGEPARTEDGEESGEDDELQKRLEALGLALPAVPTSPLNVDDDTADASEADPPPSGEPKFPLEGDESVASEAKPANEEDAAAGTDAKSPTVDADKDGTEDGDFVTPVETVADAGTGDDLSQSQHSEELAVHLASFATTTTTTTLQVDPLASNAITTPTSASSLVAPTPMSASFAAPTPLSTPAVGVPPALPFGGFVSPAHGTPLPVASAPPAEEDEEEERAVPRDLLIAALHAGAAGQDERYRARVVMGEEDLDVARERVEAMVRGSPVKEEEEDVLSKLAKRLEGLRGSSDSLE
ncbi:hypothetical protein HDU97_000627 [Phlyctochytrium planicorne]|nr:hypothetical protein HDU97_000627 [Phlyctochytrium planicorne]